MKTEKSILVLTSLSVLVFAVFTSYNTPPVNRSVEIETQIEIENYKREMIYKIATDNGRMKELKSRYEIEKSESRREDEDRLASLRRKIDEMQTELNNYEGNGLEEWELFKEKFDRDLNDQHDSLINLIIKTSHSLNNNDSIQSFVKP